MDQVENPFAPGAGTPPPELVGREKILEEAQVALERSKRGRSTRSELLLGLRGVGKTVLLNRIDEMAQKVGHQTIVLEAPEDRRLAEMLVPPLRTLLFNLSRLERTRNAARRTLGILRAFAGVFKVTIADIEFGVQSEVGVADSGRLEADLPALLIAVATAAKEAGSPITLLIDEVQYLSSDDLSALIVSIHKMGQKGLPFVLFGAGLPQLAGLAGEAKSYAERLFVYPHVGPLSADAARDAIRVPIENEGVGIGEDALSSIVERTEGYPYFLQEWGYHTWNAAKTSPITSRDVDHATTETLIHLDASFFRVRLDRLTTREKDYMRAMAELGPGPHRSGDIAQMLKMKVTDAGPLRNGLIKKGMIFSPQHGDTAFTVPMFDDFMKRSLPGWALGAIPATETLKPTRLSQPKRKKKS